MSILNPYEKNRIKRASVLGSPEVDIFALERCPDKVMRLRKVGKRNIQEEINSYKDSCDIYNLLGRFLAEGGILSTPVISDQVVDTTIFPKSIFEVQENLKNTKHIYDNMPEAVRKQFTYKQFINAVNTEDGVTKITEIVQSAVSDSLDLKGEIVENA